MYARCVCGLAHDIDPLRVLTGDDILQPKPAPEIFLRAAQLGGAQPQNCLVVEDSAAGVRGALAAGMQVVGMVGLMGCSDFAELGVPCIRSLRALEQFIADSRRRLAIER